MHKQRWRSICVHDSIDQAGHSEHHATDVMTTWRETAPSIIHWSPDDRSRVRIVDAEGSGSSSKATYNSLTRILLGYNHINTSGKCTLDSEINMETDEQHRWRNEIMMIWDGIK